MSSPIERRAIDRQRLVIGGQEILLGETRQIMLKVSERYTGAPVRVPVHVIRSRQCGPHVFVTAAVHGDELNGTGIVRQLMFEPPELMAGTLVLLPMVNVFGVEQHSRYLPDRRDLNRAFPGSASGSLTSRVANTLFRNIVRQCDYGIDLHSAPTGRTNFPHVRADLSVPGVKELAMAFGCELVINHRGQGRTLRAAATRAGCPVLLLEAGEALKIEPAAVRLGVRGVRNVLAYLGMCAGDLVIPGYQSTVSKTEWLRSSSGGLLRFHVSPGEVVDKGTPVATVDNLFEATSVLLRAPRSGVLIGMRTLPAVRTGDPVCHIAVPTRSPGSVRTEVESARGTLHRRIQAEQADDILIEPTRDDSVFGSR